LGARQQDADVVSACQQNYVENQDFPGIISGIDEVVARYY
jgi:hypothetical protein